MKRQKSPIPVMDRLMVVSNRKHPHFGCTGYLTGEVISVCGSMMAKLRAESCKHGTDFFVERGDIQEIEG